MSPGYPTYVRKESRGSVRKKLKQQHAQKCACNATYIALVTTAVNNTPRIYIATISASVKPSFKKAESDRCVLAASIKQ